MSLTSNASSDEMTSPFYRENKMLCEQWQDFILEKEGKVKGSYNAWSYLIKSKLTTKRTWLIEVKKATYSNGNLLLSSKYQNLQESIIFKTRFSNLGCDNFCISRSLFKRRSRNHPLFLKVKKLLIDQINDKSLYEAQFKNDELKITIHNRNNRFDIVDHILSLDYEG